MTLDPAFVVAPVNPLTFGSFVEHMGRCVYTGIYEPDHPSADDDGFRGDVLDLVRELGVTLVRYPGGNFVSGYRWEDGVGPVETRPTRLDHAWHSTETNAFGLDEFMRWCRKAEVEPMMAINLGTRGVQEAMDLLEYANHPEGTHFSDLRRNHGAKEPYGIKMWCLGNEMDGPWQTGHKTAHEYGRLAAEAARAMRAMDPKLELIACGSSDATLPTFGSWDATVMELAYDQIDHISVHAYYDPDATDLDSYLASAVDFDRRIDSIVAIADSVGAQLHTQKRIDLSVDEWNVWYQRRFTESGFPPEEWDFRPRLIEDVYTVADAMVVGNLLISLLRHNDRVAAACQAQLANVIGPILTEPGGPAWRQTIFHPFAQVARFARGNVLQTAIDAPTYGTEKFGDVPVVDAVATHDPDGGQLVVFAVNRHPSESVEVAVDLRGLVPMRVTSATALADDDIQATNTQSQPDRVEPTALDATVVDGSTVRATLAPVSWNVLHLEPLLRTPC